MSRSRRFLRHLRPLVMPMVCLSLILALVPAVLAEELAFNKTKYSSVKQPKEADVNLSITGSKILIEGKGKRAKGIDIEIPFLSVDSMSYEFATRHRVGEGLGVMAVSLGAGAIVMATKTKSHWLVIEHHEDESRQVTVLRLDKSEYKDVIATLEERTGKHIAVVNSKTSPLNPIAGSKDMDEVIPFGKAKVAAAVKSAMETEGCNVTNATDGRIECKRGRGYSERTGYGSEKVTATLEAKGDQTRVRLWTGKGFHGRMSKRNWSTPIYQQMMEALQKPARSA